MGKKRKKSNAGNIERQRLKAKFGGVTQPRKEEPNIQIEIGYCMNFTWSVGRQVPRRKMQP